MIKLQNNQWAKLQVGDFKAYVSYMVELPVDLLEGFRDYFETGKETKIVINDGKDEFNVVLNNNKLHIERLTPCAHGLKVEQWHSTKNVLTWTKELVADIESNMDKWVEFCEPDPNAYSTKKANIIRLNADVKNVMAEM